jgi:hypothetical protein
MQPHRDAEIIRGKVPRLDPSIPPSPDEVYPDGQGASALLINACREHPYLPVSLPREDFMEAAKARWAKLGLPELDLQEPVHGYPLTLWTEENAEEAELAVTGRYYETGEKLAGRRKNPEPSGEAERLHQRHAASARGVVRRMRRKERCPRRYPDRHRTRIFHRRRCRQDG